MRRKSVMRTSVSQRSAANSTRPRREFSVEDDPRLQIQYAVTRILSEAGNLKEATPRLVRSVCEALHWDVGEFWLYEPESRLLGQAGYWCRPGLKCGLFRSQGRAMKLSSGQGLPGRVFARGRVVSSADVTRDKNFARVRAAARAGLRRGFGFPIRTDGKVLGVMTFFTRRADPLDNRLVEMFRALGGQIGGFIERQHAANLLAENEERYRSVVEALDSGVIVRDRSGVVRACNHSAQRILRLPAKQIVGRTARDWRTIHEDGSPFLQEEYPSVLTLESGKARRNAIMGVYRDDGSVVWISVNSQPLARPGHREPYAVVLSFTDISKQRSDEEALRKSAQLLRQALEEREQLSQDLHDSIIQRVYAVGMELDGCSRLAGPESAPITSKLRESVGELNSIIRELRNYISGAAPQPVSRHQLGMELARLARTMQGSHFQFRLRIDPVAAARLTPATSRQIVFIAREAISNTLRHSKATVGSISLHQVNGVVRLELRDNGKGFADRPRVRTGYGLRSIATRSRKIGAKLEVQTERGRGTRIRVDIPSEEQNAAERI